ncbi:MAG: hypothetical protein Q4C48_02045 [Lachnospiraceae bacterium]|nr:hypothetical protein [Lachnospiraceae bacterium]
MKKKLAIIGSLCILAVLLVAGICFRKELFPDGKDAAAQPTARPTRAVFTENDVMRVDKENRVEREVVALISPGTKQEEVVRWLGFPNEARIADQYIAEYSCTNGEYFWIRYEWKTEEGWEGYAVDSIRITSKPYPWED